MGQPKGAVVSRNSGDIQTMIRIKTFRFAGHPFVFLRYFKRGSVGGKYESKRMAEEYLVLASPEWDQFIDRTCLSFRKPLADITTSSRNHNSFITRCSAVLLD